MSRSRFLSDHRRQTAEIASSRDRARSTQRRGQHTRRIPTRAARRVRTDRAANDPCRQTQSRARSARSWTRWRREYRVGGGSVSRSLRSPRRVERRRSEYQMERASKLHRAAPLAAMSPRVELGQHCSTRRTPANASQTGGRGWWSQCARNGRARFEALRPGTQRGPSCEWRACAPPDAHHVVGRRGAAASSRTRGPRPARAVDAHRMPP